ncbi:MAG: ArsR/SmtB family transcription factor [Methanosarcina thermophila]|uniref:ArsR family transcriptional regulator n=3 Tax=Methanosarcina thermophila TaxID=2210 RepID=A0A1I6Z523_METTE|nr:ArsR family transcriptional regulator [Methanosarcina thermophila]ALK06366.1 MAG: transcriptional regulator [Methanosarcina sp. 795]AKB12002.1 transcriptional regulator, ArsR family [Methanosarcina thermophila TM-1]AKB14806.1 transcriptional regulator, ArsR family [Methanosarcina thermophila CHTI-55]NLU56421.1 transcriptional regulator [Methanosarcina thermophila]SFT57501.1 transcriptional regulator, ArsR family [Methanosarcina thermophila]
MEKSLEKIVEIGEALSHPIRLKLLYLLAERERYVYELAKDLNLSRQVVNLHLKRLEKAGFVESDLRLDDDDMRAKKFFRLKEFEVSLSIEDIKRIFE